MRPIYILGVIMIFVLACSTSQLDRAPHDYVVEQLNKLAPVEISSNIDHLTASEKATLTRVLQAAKVMDELFLRQVNPDNPQLRQALKASTTPEDKDYLNLFDIMFGPWNRLEEDEPFLVDYEKPDGAGFYPADISKEEFNSYIEERPPLEDDFTSTFTLIRREKGRLTAIPYHEAYKEWVSRAYTYLKEAAELSRELTLKKYLDLRAEALLTDDYFDSDMAWMDLEGNLEIVIGPYEVYEDNLFNYKAAYEAFVCIVDQEESEKLSAAAQYLNAMEANLPIPDRYKNFDRGSSSPIKVVQEIFSAGDTKAGIQTTAFNLPNDERVREAKGSKKVMLKNIARAKYDKCWIPIVETILAEKPLKHVSFDAYFNHVLMHEMSHGLGPGNITLADGTETSVSKELKETYSVIEECKADVLGVYNLIFLMEKGVYPKSMEYSVYASYLGGMFRSIRFGINEAHGGGVAIQFNYLIEKGAIVETDEGKLDVVADKVIPVLTDLARTLLTIQAEGDYKGAKDLIEQYRVMTPLMQRTIEELKHVPIDIRPSYSTAMELLGEN
ncbi:peptidase [candidate division KSB1 bacterium]|nr:peptidase [candidate division KSB1 bacterium]